MAIKKNVKVTDLPKKKLEEEEEFDEEEDLEDLLKITVSKAGQKEIEDQWDDVEDTWKDIKSSQPVRNVANSAKRWGNSKEVKDYQALEKKFLKTPRGKRMVHEWEDLFKELDGAIHKTKNGIHIDNEKIHNISDEADDVADQYDELKKTPW